MNYRGALRTFWTFQSPGYSVSVKLYRNWYQSRKQTNQNAVKTSSSNMYKLWWYASSYHQKALHTVSSRKKTPIRKEKTNSLSFETATQARKIGAQWLNRSNSDTSLHTFSFAQANGHTHRATIGEVIIFFFVFYFLFFFKI